LYKITLYILQRSDYNTVDGRRFSNTITPSKQPTSLIKYA